MLNSKRQGPYPLFCIPCNKLLHNMYIVYVQTSNWAVMRWVNFSLNYRDTVHCHCLLFMVPKCWNVRVFVVYCYMYFALLKCSTLMWIRIRLFTLLRMRIRILLLIKVCRPWLQPFTLMRIRLRIQLPNIMWIHPDPDLDPQPLYEARYAHI
jgi:hypothetical protein